MFFWVSNYFSIKSEFSIVGKRREKENSVREKELIFFLQIREINKKQQNKIKIVFGLGKFVLLRIEVCTLTHQKKTVIGISSICRNTVRHKFPQQFPMKSISIFEIVYSKFCENT